MPWNLLSHPLHHIFLRLLGDGVVAGLGQITEPLQEDPVRVSPSSGVLRAGTTPTLVPVRGRRQIKHVQGVIEPTQRGMTSDDPQACMVLVVVAPAQL